MGIDDDIWNNARSSLRHVLRLQNHPHSALLSMTARELVTNLRCTQFSQADLHERISLAIPVLENLVYESALIITWSTTHIAKSLRSCRQNHARRHLQRNHLAHQNIIRIYKGVLRNEAICAQFPVITITQLLGHIRIWATKALLLT